MEISGKKYRWGIDDVCWVLVVFILTWQGIWPKITIIFNFMIFLLFLHNLWTTTKLSDQKQLLKIWICVLMLVAYSIILANKGNLIMRFSLIMLFICYAYYIRMKNPRAVIKSLVFVTIPFAVSLILLELLLLFYVDESSAQVYISEIYETGLGGIYKVPAGFYRVHLRGCASLPFVYMLVASSTIFQKRAKIILCTLYLLASIFAGNFMFLMAFVTFHMMRLFMRSRSRSYLYNHVPLYIAILCVLPVFFTFIGHTLEEKKDYSNRIRIEQVELLINDMTKSSMTTLFGQGLGNAIKASTSLRDYGDETIYYEVQTAYFLNQLGIIPFLIFIAYNILCTRRFIVSWQLRVVYCSYVIYAMSNPYMLDTTQVVVIISLLCANTIENKIKCDYV